MPHTLPSLPDRCGLLQPIPFGDDPAAKSVLLLRFGDNSYIKGGSRGAFVFDRKDAVSVIGDFDSRRHDMVVDYDHTTLRTPGDAPASGWISALVLGDDGLYATISWTEKAAGHLRAREYRYLSPVIYFDAKGHPSAIHSVALTNHPALDGYPSLAANDTKNTESEMNEHLKAIAGQLGITLVLSDDGTPDETATAAAIGKRIGEMADLEKKTKSFLDGRHAVTFDDVNGQIAGMVPAAEKAELEAKLAGIEAEKAVAKAFNDGKLVENQRQWAMDYATRDLVAFNSFVASAPKVAPGPAGGIDPGKPSRSGDGDPVTFDDNALKIFRECGITPEYLKENLKKEN